MMRNLVVMRCPAPGSFCSWSDVSERAKFSHSRFRLSIDKPHNRWRSGEKRRCWRQNGSFGTPGGSGRIRCRGGGETDGRAERTNRVAGRRQLSDVFEKRKPRENARSTSKLMFSI